MSHEIFIECTSPIITQFQNEHACSGDFGQKISQNTAHLAHLPTKGGSYWCSYYESLQASWKPLGPKSGFGLLLKKGFWINFEDLDFYSPLGVVSMWPIFSLKKARIWHLGTTRQPLPPPHDTRGSNFELLLSRRARGVHVVMQKHHLGHLNRAYGSSSESENMQKSEFYITIFLKRGRILNTPLGSLKVTYGIGLPNSPKCRRCTLIFLPGALVHALLTGRTVRPVPNFWPGTGPKYAGNC